MQAAKNAMSSVKDIKKRVFGEVRSRNLVKVWGISDVAVTSNGNERTYCMIRERAFRYPGEAPSCSDRDRISSVETYGIQRRHVL